MLIKHEKLNSTIRDEARSLYRKLPGISTLHLTPQHFSYLNGGKNTRYYKFVISVCKFIVNNSIEVKTKDTTVSMILKETKKRCHYFIKSFFLNFAAVN